MITTVRRFSSVTNVGRVEVEAASFKEAENKIVELAGRKIGRDNVIIRTLCENNHPPVLPERIQSF